MLADNSSFIQARADNTTACATLGSGQTVPADIELMILIFLPAKDLHNVARISRLWHAFSTNKELWDSVHARDIAHKNRLQNFFVNAIIKKDYDSVRYCLHLGVQINNRLIGEVAKCFASWNMQIRGTFTNPTLLTIAANYAYNYQGIQIVYLLLAHKADVSAVTDYHDIRTVQQASSRFNSLAYDHTSGLLYNDSSTFDEIQLIGRQRVVESSVDCRVKTLLYLSEFENAIINNKNTSYLLNLLKEACDANPSLAKEYLTAFVKNQDCFTGIQQTLTAAQINRIKTLPAFINYYREPLPGFFSRNWPWCIVASYVTFAAAATPIGDKLGTCIISLLTSTPVPAMLTVGIGAIIIGLGVAYLCYLISKAYDYYIDNHREIHFPMKIDHTPTKLLSEYSGTLFPKSYRTHSGSSAAAIATQEKKFDLVDTRFGDPTSEAVSTRKYRC